MVVFVKLFCTYDTIFVTEVYRRHRTHNRSQRTHTRVRHSLEEGETISEHRPSSDEISENNFVNETSVEQNNLLSFVSFDREHHCDQTYLGDENCVICTEKFDEDDHLPILLPCGHIAYVCRTGIQRSYSVSF
jgi:hypothetical protein